MKKYLARWSNGYEADIVAENEENALSILYSLDHEHDDIVKEIKNLGIDDIELIEYKDNNK